MKKMAIVLGLMVLAAATASAGDSGGFGFGIGSVSVKETDGSHVWLTANMRTLLSRNLALEPEVGWWQQGVGDGRGNNFYTFGGNLLLVLPARKVDVFGGAGIGGLLYRGAYGLDNATRLEYHFLGGADLLLNNTVSFLGAGRYEIIRVPGGDLKLLKFYGGIRLRAH
jgi:hypothetical protein